MIASQQRVNSRLAAECDVKLGCLLEQRQCLQAARSLLEEWCCPQAALLLAADVLFSADEGWDAGVVIFRVG